MGSAIPSFRRLPRRLRVGDCDCPGRPRTCRRRRSRPLRLIFIDAANSVAVDLRAVVFVVEGTAKGTTRSAQEYSAPLLMLSGVEYASTPFSALHTRLCDALRDDRPRLLAEVVQPDGGSKLIFESESVGDVIAPRRFDD